MTTLLPLARRTVQAVMAVGILSACLAVLLAADVIAAGLARWSLLAALPMAGVWVLGAPRALRPVRVTPSRRDA